MKLASLKHLGCALVFLPLLAHGDDTHTYNFNNVNLNIPDRGTPGSDSGVVNNQIVSGLAGTIITSIQVTLNIAAATDINNNTVAINGDFYVSLVHTVGTTQEGFSVLLNRSGVSSLNPPDSIGGYYDNGFNVTFSDAAPSDIHFYQDTEGYNVNGDGQLTGTWQPDGENINPNSDASAFNNALANQTAMLSSLNGYGADGTWSLFLYDAASGGAGQLLDWTLTINTVPEPGEVALVTFGLLACIGLHRKFSRK
jgi:subtilisin-like proprotein convertase family protein